MTKDYTMMEPSIVTVGEVTMVISSTVNDSCHETNLGISLLNMGQGMTFVLIQYRHAVYHASITIFSGLETIMDD